LILALYPPQPLDLPAIRARPAGNGRGPRRSAAGEGSEATALLEKTSAAIYVMQYHLSIPVLAVFDRTIEIARANQMLNEERRGRG